MKVTNVPSNWLIHLWRDTLLYLMISAIASSAFAAPVDCTPQPIDAATKKAIKLFLKTKYGDAYANYDVDYPSLVDLGDGSGSKAPDNVYSLGFSARKNRQSSESVTPIVIDFERCTNKIVGFIELHSSHRSQEPAK
jgi:hypothetical protein